MSSSKLAYLPFCVKYMRSACAMAFRSFFTAVVEIASMPAAVPPSVPGLAM